MKVITATLECVWQLPQNLLGAGMAVLLSRRARKRERRGAVLLYFCFSRYGGLSVGRYVFLHVDSQERLVRHELGHCRQSRLLGPLYLLVIGLPSLLWAAAYPHVARLRPGADYFSFFTERWADRLGGVARRS
jgi:hypothetical protein